MGIREIARKFRHSRRKVREVLAHAVPQPYTLTAPREAPKLGRFHTVIDEILRLEETQPVKQRHTAARLFRRLKGEHGYLGGYAQVQRYVAAHRQRERETFIPLDHAPGRRMEFDFGEIQVDFPEGRRKVSVLIGTWAFSYAAFAIALPTQRTEAILHGMVAAFEFFECVPKEVWWDNPKTVALEILRGRDRRVSRPYQELASHYNFAALFCMPARGNEKPHVENRVKWLEREWATPVPQVGNFEELNALLRARCEADRRRVATGQTATIGARFDQDRIEAVPLPLRRFEPCITRDVRADKYRMRPADPLIWVVCVPGARDAEGRRLASAASRGGSSGGGRPGAGLAWPAR
jgi:transposase